MQQLGNFAKSNLAQAPVFVAVLYDASSNEPSFALIQESPTDVPAVFLDDQPIPCRGLLGDCDVTLTRPTGDAGIIRRTCDLTIQTEHSKGYAFFKDALTKKLYYGGATVRSFYFGLYAMDRSKIFEDLKDCLFLGFFQVDNGVAWQEGNGETTIPLIDLLTNDINIVGATTESIPESFFLFNSWYDQNIVPKVFGQVPRIRLLNSFPSISIKQLSGAINGRVESNYTNSSSTIDLEKNSDKSSVLRQIVALGGTVKIKMHDGEVIEGTLTYNSGTNIVTLHPTLRNTYYAKGKGYTYAFGESPSDWTGATSDHRAPSSWSLIASVILDAKRVIQDPSGYAQANIKYYDNTQPARYRTKDTVVKLNGFDSDKKDVVNHSPWNYDNLETYDSSGLSQDFTTAVLTHAFPLWPTTWEPVDYIYFDSVPKDIQFYFNDPSTSAAGSGSIGDPWTLVAIVPGAVTYECYVRNGFSHFSNDHIYAEGDQRLIKIPTGHVVSVTDSTTVSGLSNMAKIVLDMAPMDMGIGATSNVVYTDALYKTASNENRTERILYEILKESSFLYKLAGNNINGGYYTDNWLPYIGYLADGTENVSQIIDRICFQCGATFRWSMNTFELRTAAFVSGAESTVNISGTDYVLPGLPFTDEKEMLENTAKVTFGKLLTSVDGNGFEYIPVYFDVDYGGWQDPFYKPAKQLVNRAIKPNERKVSYKFDLINDPTSMKYAIGAFLSIGHPSGLATVQRTLSADMTMNGCRWEAMDPIVFKDFPLISTADETDANLDTANYPRYLKPSDGKRRLMGAVCAVDQVVYSFDMINPKVSLIAKMSQTFVNANGVNVYAPPYPPTSPPAPPNDPAQPPGGSGPADLGSTNGGGGYDPMDMVVSGDDTIEIVDYNETPATLSVTVNPLSINNGGFKYNITIEDVYDYFGMSIDSDGSGSFADKLNDSYVPPTYHPIISFDADLFQPFGDLQPDGPRVPFFQRQVIISFTRTINKNRNSLDYYQDKIDWAINVTLKRLVDIDAS